MIYLKKFGTTAEYNAYTADTANFILPNVSLITETNGVAYHPYVDPYNGHDYVDLGLPSGTKWATMNVGASSETDYGNYYQYGKGAAQYAATSGQSDYSGMENPLATSADTAAQVWGGEWHMPTTAQCQELIDNCIWTWTTSGGTNGYSVSKNGKSIFFPAAGRWYNGSQSRVGSYGYYWSSSPYDSSNAYDLTFRSSSKGMYEYSRSGGFLVRPVVG